jgi:hypothetical protein
MAFTPQDDTGSVTGANAYGSVALFKVYHTDRGNDYSSYTDQEIEQAIVNAADYLDYRWCFVGIRLTQDQETEWPRRDAEDSQGYVHTGIPRAVLEATYEYAFIDLGSPLDPSPSRDDRGRSVVEKVEKVGPLLETTKYENADTYSPPEYPVADRKLRQLVVSPGWADRG